MFWSHCTISRSRNWLCWQGQAIFLVFIANIHPGRERVILILAKRPSYIWGHLEVQCTFDTDYNQIVQIDVFILPSFATIISPMVRVDKELEELLIANLTLVNIQERLWRRDVDVFVSWLMYLSFSTTLCVKLSIGWAHRRLLASVWRTAKHPEPFHTPKSKIHQILWILLWSVRWKEDDGMSCEVQRVIWEITSVIQIAVEFKMNCVGYRKWKCNETYTRVTQ